MCPVINNLETLHSSFHKYWLQVHCVGHRATGEPWSLWWLVFFKCKYVWFFFQGHTDKPIIKMQWRRSTGYTGNREGTIAKRPEQGLGILYHHNSHCPWQTVRVPSGPQEHSKYCTQKDIVQTIGYTSDGALRSKQPGGKSRKVPWPLSPEKGTAPSNDNYFSGYPARTWTTGEMTMVVKLLPKQSTNKGLVSLPCLSA